MKTTKDVMLKTLCHKSIFSRELYILQVLMYWFEREIVSVNYDYSKANIDKKLLDNAYDILEFLVRNYKEEILLKNNSVTQTHYYLFTVHNYGIEEYLKEYAVKKGRLQLNNPPVKLPWYKKVWNFVSNMFRNEK